MKATINMFRKISLGSLLTVTAMMMISQYSNAGLVLHEFNALKGKTDVSIKWTTLQEDEITYFTIEKTLDGIHFESVYSQQGSGFSSMRVEYLAVDQHPEFGTSYYRLKYTDMDGVSGYSALEAVEYSAEENKPVIYPNPGTGTTINIAYSSRIHAENSISISNAGGIQVYSNNWSSLSHGSNSFNIESEAKLESGIYFLVLNIDGTVHTSKLMVK